MRLILSPHRPLPGRERFWRARLRSASLVCIVLGYVFAVLSPQHFLPIPSFYQEVAFGGLMAFAAVLLVASGELRDGWSLPWSSIAALSLAVVLLVGLRFRPVSYPDFTIWPLGSLLIAAMAAWFGHALQRRGDARVLMEALLVAFALAGIATAAIVWIQLVEPGKQTLWLFPRLPLQPPSGNLGQRNQAALVQAFGLLALVYWGRRESSRIGLRKIIAIVGSMLLLSGISLTQSRIAFGFLAVAGASFGFLWAGPNYRVRGAFTGLALVALAYMTVQWLIYSGFGLGQLFPPATQRLADRGAGQRISMLKVAWAEWRYHPWWGGGFGSFSSWEMRQGLAQKEPLFSTNAHNIVGQIAAELGTLGLLTVFLPAAFSLAQMGRKYFTMRAEEFQAWQVIAFAVCAMLAGYSLTEYPLWYDFFLIPFALCWGLLDSTVINLHISKTLRALLLVISISMIGFLSWSSMRYLTIVKLVALGNDHALFEKMQISYRKTLIEITPSFGFSPAIDALTFFDTSVSKFLIRDKIILGERATDFYTGPFFLQKLAYLYATNGQARDASVTLAKACAYYPSDCQGIGENLKNLSRKFPKTYLQTYNLFREMPQSGIRSKDRNLLKPWAAGGKGTVVVIDPEKTLFGFDLARVAAGIQQKAGRFAPSP